MKSYQIYEILETFEKMWTDRRFTLKAKINMGQEFINAMPPVALASNSKNTMAAAKEYMMETMKRALLDEQAKRNVEPKNKQTQSKSSNKTSVDKQKQTPSSDNKDESGGRTTVAKAPKASEKRGSKKQ